jgi:hypothetical protein
MAKNIKRFGESVSYDHKILDNDGKFGELRIKPSTIMWKAKNAQTYRGIDIEKFADWIKNSPDAKDMKQ